MTLIEWYHSLVAYANFSRWCSWCFLLGLKWTVWDLNSSYTVQMCRASQVTLYSPNAQQQYRWLSASLRLDKTSNEWNSSKPYVHLWLIFCPRLGIAGTENYDISTPCLTDKRSASELRSNICRKSESRTHHHLLVRQRSIADRRSSFVMRLDSESNWERLVTKQKFYH